MVITTDWQDLVSYLAVDPVMDMVVKKPYIPVAAPPVLPVAAGQFCIPDNVTLQFETC